MVELTNDELILAGLGKGNNLNLRKTVNKEIGASLYRKHFLERINLLPKDVQRDLENGKAQISDAPWYATAAINGTRAELIKASQPEQKGITNIDNGKLGKGRYMTLSAIRLLYDKNSIDGMFTDPFPAELLNGEWELELDGRKVFTKMSVREFHDGFYGYNINLPFGLYIVKNPKIIEPQTPIELNVDAVKNMSGFLKIYLGGTTVYSY